MSKSTLVSLIVLVVVGAGTYTALNNPFSSGSGIVSDLSKSFMEDLQFKDFRSSSLYHHLLDQGRLDIGKTLELLFAVKPEFLDILGFDISRVDVDSSGDRAKVLVRTRYKVLNEKKAEKKRVREGKVILYWIKRHPQCPLGGSCSTGGLCVNERGITMLRPVEDDAKESQKDRANNLRQAKEGASGENYACDNTQEKQWYMNLDSTLKQKDYGDHKEKKK